MFEEMGEPRLARRLVGGADLVPDHVGHHRRAVIWKYDDVEAVRQCEAGDLGPAPGMGGSGECRGKGGDGERQSVGHEFALVGLGVAPTMHVPTAERECKRRSLVSDSEVRIIVRQPRLRTSESKDTSNLLI